MGRPMVAASLAVMVTVFAAITPAGVSMEEVGAVVSGVSSGGVSTGGCAGVSAGPQAVNTASAASRASDGIRRDMRSSVASAARERAADATDTTAPSF